MCIKGFLLNAAEGQRVTTHPVTPPFDYTFLCRNMSLLISLVYNM